MFLRNSICIWILVDSAGEAEVQVRVTDMNDNAPYFKERQYTARVPENTDIGTAVITVTAEDEDEGSYWSSAYSFNYSDRFFLAAANH